METNVGKGGRYKSEVAANEEGTRHKYLIPSRL